MNTNPQTTPTTYSYSNVAEFINTPSAESQTFYSGLERMRQQAEFEKKAENAVDFPAILSSGEEEFDIMLEQLRVEAEAERNREADLRKAEQIKRQEAWLRKRPILNKLVAGDTMVTDKEAITTMQPSYESRGNELAAASENDALLNEAMQLSQPIDAYGGHPENVIEPARNEAIDTTVAASLAERAVYNNEPISLFASPEAKVAPIFVQEALNIGVDVTALRAKYLSDFPEAA